MNTLKVATFLLFLGTSALGTKDDTEGQIPATAKSNPTNEAKNDTSNRTKRQFILTRFELLPLPTRTSNRFLVIPAPQRQSTNSNNQVGNIIIQPARIIFQRVLPSVTPPQSQNARQNQPNFQSNTSGFTRPQSGSAVRSNAAIIVPLGGTNTQRQTSSLSQTPQRFQQVRTQPSRSQQQPQNIQPSFSRPSSNVQSPSVLVADQIFRQTEQDRQRQQQQQLFQRQQQNFFRSFQQPEFQSFQNNFLNSGFNSLSSSFPRLQGNTQNRFRTQQVQLQQGTFDNQAFSQPASGRNFGPLHLRDRTTILRSFPTSTGGPTVQPTDFGKQLSRQNLSDQRTQSTPQPQPPAPTNINSQATGGTNTVPQAGGNRITQAVTNTQQPSTSPGFNTLQPQQNTFSSSPSNARLPLQNSLLSTTSPSSFTTSNVGVPLPTVVPSPNAFSRGPATPTFASQGVGVPLPSPGGSNTQASFNRGTGQQFFIRPESREIFDTREILSSREFFDTREVLDSREIFDSRELLRSRELFDTREILSGENFALNNRPVFGSSVNDFDRTDEVFSSEVLFRGRK